MFVVKYEQRLKEGLLFLRDIGEDGEAEDLPIMKEWKSARALLTRYKAQGSSFLGGAKCELGKVWIESLPGMHGTPWLLEEDDYAQSVVRTRICLVPSPDAYSHSAGDRVLLGVGVVNVVEHRTLHSETNLSTHSRVHLIVDVKRPETDGQ